jgi:hypothetical protein
MEEEGRERAVKVAERQAHLQERPRDAPTNEKDEAAN